jgi:hypothetical protein
MREHEPDPVARGQIELRHDGFKIMTVGAQTVQPNHRGGVFSRGVENHGALSGDNLKSVHSN